MKTVRILLASAVWVWLSVTVAAAHEHGDGHCHGLCHHWENPAYLAEMRLQAVIMAVIVLAYTAWRLASRHLRARRRGIC